MLKSIISFIVSIILMLSPFTVVIPKDSDTNKASLNTDNYSVDGRTSLGNVFSEAMKKYGNSEETETDYSIKDITTTDDLVSLNISNEEECAVLVSACDENTLEVIDTEIVDVAAGEDQTVDVDFSEELPEYYTVKAVAIDENEEPLCNVYTDEDNTQWYGEFIDSTIYDYNDSSIINLDDSIDDNFAVFNEQVVVLSADEVAMETTEFADTFLLGKTTKTDSLKKGDVIAYNTDNAYKTVIGKITKMTPYNEGFKIVLEETELDETFSLVKIHYDAEQAEFSDSESDTEQTGIYDSKNDEQDMLFTLDSANSGSVSGTKNVSKTFSFKFGKVTFSAGASVTFEYNVLKKYAKVSLSVSPSANIHIQINYSTSTEIQLGKVTIPVVAGVDIIVPVSVVLSFSASITFDTTVSAKYGFSWSTSSGLKNISTRPRVDSELKIEGHFYVGIKISPTVSLLYGICEARIIGEVGAQLNATSKWNYSSGQTTKHDCGLQCIHCDVDVPISVGCGLKIKILWWTPVDKTWNLWKTTINDVIVFHYSIKYKDFGLGPCDHYSYLTTIRVLNEAGNPIKNAKVDGTAVGSNGTVQKWYSDGQHTISVKANGYCSKNVGIGVSGAKTYTVKLRKGSSSEVDNESDSSFSSYKKKKNSYGKGTGGYGGGSSYVAPLTYTEPLTGVVLSTAVSGQRRSDTAWVQRELKKLGYYSSEPDGYYGYATAEAVRRFQTDYDLSITGKVNLNVVEVIKKPLKKVSAPNLKLTSSANITNGDIVSVSWDAVSSASEYNVYVYNSSGTMVANAIGTKATNAAFVLYEKGTYTIKAESKNDRFTSSMATLGTTITVKDPLLVTFENIDGTILCKQYVAYGAAATAPAAPEKEGYTFSKWDTDFSKITQDGLIVKPIFTKNQYTVKFLNTDGNEIITQNNKYYFGETAIAPEETAITVPSGYKFIGWDKSFENIYEDITVKPVIVWENDDIPIIVDECNAVKDDGYGYNVTVTLRNYEKQRTNGRVVVALKTSDERFVTMTESSAFTLKKSDANNNFASTETMDIFVPCVADISYIDVYVVNTYDDLIPISDTYRVCVSNEETVENESNVQTYSNSVDSSLAGKRAILFIYKIGDAADFTNEFIGQTVIDENGNYSFNYNLREIPSIETGDYYVVLGIEGAEKSIYLDQIEAPKPIYTVVFKDFDGTVLKTEEVAQGEHATLPEENPDRAGYAFAGWDYTNSAIYEDLTITAVYAHKKYTVVFIDWTNKRFDAQTYYYGEPLRTPDLSTLDDYSAIGWEDYVEGMPVTENMVITAKYEKKRFTVNFYDYNGNIVDTQLVEYGESAIAPELNEDDYNFFGWDNESFECVTCSLNIMPYFSYAENTATPYSNVQSGIYANTVNVSLNCEDENSDIYYSVNGSDFVLYTSPIIVGESSTIEYYASSFGKNDSYTASNYYIINRVNEEQNWKVPVTVYGDGDVVGVYFVDYASSISENDLYSPEDGYDFIGFSLEENLENIVSDDFEITQPVNLFVKNETKNYTVTFKDSNGEVIDVQNVAYMEAASEPEVIVEQSDVVFVGWDTDNYLCVTQNLEVNAVTVNSKDYLSLTLNRENYTMVEGYTYNLKPTITGETSGEIFWESSDENVAVVDENGKVTALSDGIVAITASLLGTDVSRTCYITVLKNPDMSITLNNESKYIEYGDCICGVSPSDNTVATVKNEIASDSIRFYSQERELSDNESVATGTVVKMYDANNNEIDSAILVVVGDIDGNGEANLQDASHISKYLVNKELLNDYSLIAADVNGDGEINNKDVSMIMRYQVNKEHI